MSEEIQAIDWGQPGRRDEYQFELVTPRTFVGTGRYIGHEYGKSSISYGYYTDNYRSASFELLEEPSLNYLIRVHHRIVLPDGTDYSEILGTFFIDDFDKTSEKGVSVWNVSAYGTWLAMTKSKISYSGSDPMTGYTIPSTKAQIDNWAHAQGGLTRLISATKPERVATVSWEYGDTFASIFHNIAAVIGAMMQDDDEGYLTIFNTPVYDETTPIDYEFVEGKNCTLIPSYTETDTKKDKVNRCCFIASDEEISGSYLTRLDASDPFSFQNIGRFVDYNEELQVEEGETNDQLNSRLKAKATTYLAENSGSIDYVEFSHVGIPELRYGNCIRFYNLSDAPQPYEVRAYLTNMDLTLGRGMITKSKAKIYLKGTA